MSASPLTKCEECGYEITADTSICINCGESIHGSSKGGIRSVIKRLIFLLIALYILLSSLEYMS